jgi:hypothetical protein
MESAAEGSFGDRAFKEDKVIGSAAGRGEGGICSRGEEADNSDFVVGVADEDGLRGLGVSGTELDVDVFRAAAEGFLQHA